jgi:hypothetical protein
MEKYKCKICGKKVTPNASYIASHVRRSHNIELFDYCKKYFNNIGSESDEIRKCISCNSEIIPKLILDVERNSFQYDYEGFICRFSRRSPSDECKDKISQKILGLPYEKKSYEPIGSRIEFLAYKYQISLEEALKMKSLTFESLKKNNKHKSDDILFSELAILKQKRKANNSTTSLPDYIIRYGEILGRQKYNQRNKKIGESNKLDYYIQKYGKKEGQKIWENRFSFYKKYLGPSKSKASERISSLLDEIDIEYTSEKPINVIDKTYIVDYYLEKENVIIEFFGDYWHCNPKKFDPDYYHKILKKTASEKWLEDKVRLDLIQRNVLNCSILIVWEDSIIEASEIKKHIDDIKGKDLIIYI